jgi:hypothetical protein
MIWIRENIANIPSFEPFNSHIEVIESNVYSNPTLCVETCKSLIEGICKTILTNKNIEYQNTITFNVLVQNTISAIINDDDVFRTDLTELGRRIASVSQKLGEIRNNVGFVSHGMDVLNPRLTETVSVFASKITDNIGGFILRCYHNNRNLALEQRIHYEDCLPFNESFDNENPLTIGVIVLSASHVLFQQDYEAYKETYFEYLEDLKNPEDNVAEV